MDVSADPAIKSAYAPQSAAVGGTDAPDVPIGQAADLRTQILTRIEEQTTPAPPPKKWGFLGATKTVRQLSGDPGELVKSLVAEFGTAQLLAAGIVVPSPENEVRLSPIFGDPSSSFVILRNANNATIDAISARGLPSSARPDWLRLAA